MKKGLFSLTILSALLLVSSVDAQSRCGCGARPSAPAPVPAPKPVPPQQAKKMVKQAPKQTSAPRPHRSHK